MDCCEGRRAPVTGSTKFAGELNCGAGLISQRNPKMAVSRGVTRQVSCANSEISSKTAERFCCGDSVLQKLLMTGERACTVSPRRLMEPVASRRFGAKRR